MTRRQRLFAYRLAAHLGWPNVDEMLGVMTARQFAEWQAYYACEPFGMDWEQTANLCATVVAAAGGKCRPEMFLPVKRPSVEQSPAQQMAIFRLLAAVNGGRESKE